MLVKCTVHITLVVYECGLVSWFHHPTVFVGSRANIIWGICGIVFNVLKRRKWEFYYVGTENWLTNWGKPVYWHI